MSSTKEETLSLVIDLRAAVKALARREARGYILIRYPLDDGIINTQGLTEAHGFEEAMATFGVPNDLIERGKRMGRLAAQINLRDHPAPVSQSETRGNLLSTYSNFPIPKK